jgi:hypothetical protein
VIAHVCQNVLQSLVLEKRKYMDTAFSAYYVSTCDSDNSIYLLFI